MIFTARTLLAVTVGVVIGSTVPKLPEIDRQAKLINVKPREYSACMMVFCTLLSIPAWP